MQKLNICIKKKNNIKYYYFDRFTTFNFIGNDKYSNFCELRTTLWRLIKLSNPYNRQQLMNVVLQVMLGQVHAQVDNKKVEI